MTPGNATPAPPTLRARDLPLGVLCRVGFLLSGCFWITLGLVFGVGRAIGVGTLAFLDQDVGPVFAIPAGLAGGLALALFNDALLAIGALILVLARRSGRR